MDCAEHNKSLPIVLKLSDSSPRFFNFVSFFGEGGFSSFLAPFFPPFPGDCDFPLGLAVFLDCERLSGLCLEFEDVNKLYNRRHQIFISIYVIKVHLNLKKHLKIKIRKQSGSIKGT